MKWIIQYSNWAFIQRLIVDWINEQKPHHIYCGILSSSCSLVKKKIKMATRQNSLGWIYKTGKACLVLSQKKLQRFTIRVSVQIKYMYQAVNLKITAWGPVNKIVYHHWRLGTVLPLSRSKAHHGRLYHEHYFCQRDIGKAFFHWSSQHPWWTKSCKAT